MRAHPAPGRMPSVYVDSLPESSQSPQEVRTTNAFIFQGEETKDSEVQCLALGHTAQKCQNSAQTPFGLTLEPNPLLTPRLFILRKSQTDRKGAWTVTWTPAHPNQHFNILPHLLSLCVCPNAYHYFLLTYLYAVVLILCEFTITVPSSHLRKLTLSLSSALQIFPYFSPKVFCSYHFWTDMHQGLHISSVSYFLFSVLWSGTPTLIFVLRHWLVGEPHLQMPISTHLTPSPLHTDAH